MKVNETIQKYVIFANKTNDMYTLSTSAITPSDLKIDITQRKINAELLIGQQTTQSYPLTGQAQGSVKTDEGYAVACVFCNKTENGIAINYLDFSKGSNNWIYAYVQAGEEMPHIVRAVKTVTGTFVDGQMLRF